MTTILVTGATGTVGSELVNLLRGRANLHLRAGVHSIEKTIPGVESAHFSYENDDAMSAACEGVDAVFWLTPITGGQLTWALRFLNVAKAANVKRLVKLSVSGMDESPLMTLAKWHLELENAIRETGIPWTSLRPNGFMQNFLTVAVPLPDGTMYSSTAEGRAAYVDVRDIAEVAVKALTEPGHEGKAYELSGPEALTMSEIAKILSEASGRDIRYVDLSDDALRQGMLDVGMPFWLVEMIIDINVHTRAGRNAQVTNVVEEITGRPATPFQQFALEHAQRWTT